MISRRYKRNGKEIPRKQEFEHDGTLLLDVEVRLQGWVNTENQGKKIQKLT